MEKVNWDVPTISGDTLNLSLEKGDRLFVVGANGSGKSALIQWLVSKYPDKNFKRITAHRQTYLESGEVNITAAVRQQQEQQHLNYDRESQSRWREINPSWRLNAVLFDLVAKENERAREITHQVDNEVCEKVADITVESPSPFNQINQLLELSSLKVKIEITSGQKLQARHSQGNAFSIAEMSDAERSAVLLAASVITADDGTVFLIDEPERHLHRSIAQPILSALFDLRKENCAFIVATHEVALPVADPDARVIILRSCQWSDSQCIGWDAEELKSNSKLPEELKRAILGSRKGILFVEGNSDSSLDLPLYRILFPNISIVPRGSCGEVEKTVLELRNFQEIHDVEAFGLIDRDDRPCEDVKRLAKKGVFALEVYSVEALYYCSDAIAAVAHQQANSLDFDVNELIESVKQNVFEMLKTRESIAKEMAARRCIRQIRKTTLSVIPKWKSVIDNPNQAISVPIDPQLYDNELELFKKLVDEEKLDQLIARYRLHKSPILSKIATTLRCPDREDYERRVLVQIRCDRELVKKLKERISQLSEVLDSPEK